MIKEKSLIREFGEYLAGKGLGDETIKAYLRYYKHFDMGLKEEELNQSYINQFLLKHPSNVTRSFLRNLFEFLDITHLKVPKLTGRKGRKERKSITKKELEVLRRWIFANKDVKFLFCLDITYIGGLRRSELMKIKIKDFQLREWAEDPRKSCRLLIHGKGKKDRYIPIKPPLMRRIIDYIQETGKIEDDYLFDFSYKTWDRVFKDAVKSTMDYNYTLHDLRRSRATYWLEQGIDILRVKERLGHSSIQTTQLYINLDREKEYKKWAEE